MNEIKPIPYKTLWAHMASIVDEREIVLQVLVDDGKLTSVSRKELEGRIKVAKLICHLIDWCANHADWIDEKRRADRRQTAKAHEEANA